MGEEWLALPPVTDNTSDSNTCAVSQLGDAVLRAAAARWRVSLRHVPQVLGVGGCELTTMEKPQSESRLRGEVQALLKSGLIGRGQGERYLKALSTLSPPTGKLPRSVCLHADGRPAAFVPVNDAVAAAAGWISARKQCTTTTYDYWDTVGGTPAAFVRPWELARKQMVSMCAPKDSVIEFGYGSIGQLQALASLGFECTGIEASRKLHALYSPDIAGVRLLYDEATGPLLRSLAREEPEGAAVFISKNTLKKGYVNPDPPHNVVMELGVSDAQFLSAVYDALCPGGIAMIYNIHPSMKPPYRSWADGRCPYSLEQCEDAGFRVKAHDADDTAFVVAMASQLGWGEHMDIDEDLFATYTLLERPRKQSSL